jgi:hypothetical protein
MRAGGSRKNRGILSLVPLRSMKMPQITAKMIGDAGCSEKACKQSATVVAPVQKSLTALVACPQSIFRSGF